MDAVSNFCQINIYQNSILNDLYMYVILYHKSNLVFTGFFSTILFLIFQQNNSALTSVFICFTSRHYYFVEKLKVMKKNLYKLNCSDGKGSHALKKLKMVCKIFVVKTMYHMGHVTKLCLLKVLNVQMNEIFTW